MSKIAKPRPGFTMSPNDCQIKSEEHYGDPFFQVIVAGKTYPVQTAKQPVDPATRWRFDGHIGEGISLFTGEFHQEYFDIYHDSECTDHPTTVFPKGTETEVHYWDYCPPSRG